MIYDDSLSFWISVEKNTESYVRDKMSNVQRKDTMIANERKDYFSSFDSVSIARRDDVRSHYYA